MNTLRDRNVSGRSIVVPDKIIVATDLGDLDYLVPHSIAQARACGAALTFVHVIPPGDALALNARAIPHENSAAMTQEATKTLARVSSGVRERGIPCDFRVIAGFPRDQIPALARETGAGRILAGTHARQQLRRFFLGSVANEILRSAEVPVFTIGPHAHEASSFGAPRSILHFVSLCTGFEDGVRMACDLAAFYRADITLLHVLARDTQTQADSDRVVEWTRLELQRVIPDETVQSSRVSVQVEIGDIVDEVLNVAAEMNADLIVLAVNREVSFWPIRGDDTVYKIIARAKSPVLSIRRTTGQRD
jgi:nucleotide-binding universal stress UspA family protein